VPLIICLWRRPLQVPPEIHKPGTVVHTVGYPLGHSEYGGGFIYHMDNNKVALGLVIGLDYTNPSLNTYKVVGVGGAPRNVMRGFMLHHHLNPAHVAHGILLNSLSHCL